MNAAGLAALALLVLLPACIPDTTGSSTSSTSGGVVSDAGEGGADDASSVDPQRAAICDQYAQAAAQCCAQGTETCPQPSAAAWRNKCLQYAASCPAMPTCFEGSDCNTLIYCAGGC
jgi:hypothetical protein